jgi:hypothetical protein
VASFFACLSCMREKVDLGAWEADALALGQPRKTTRLA